MNSLGNFIIENSGSVHPLIIPHGLTNGTGLMNPSIYNDNGKIILILRHVNYTLYHSESKMFQHQWGPLSYIHPENDMHLRTINYYLELDDELQIKRYNKINTDKFDTYAPAWDFVGLEDARLFRWDEKLYISGVRRDIKPNGEGRMELSEILVTENEVNEISRFRIPPPKDPNSYCEKNWMPILDLPYHYVKWSNPTEVVCVDPVKQTCKTTHLTEQICLPRDIRGGSQILKWEDGYIGLTHEVDLFKSEVGRKDAVYRHRFIIWDKNWNIKKYSNDFSLMSGHVEFCVGMTFLNENILISFGFQDNAAFVFKTNTEIIKKFIYENS